MNIEMIGEASAKKPSASSGSRRLSEPFPAMTHMDFGCVMIINEQ